LWKKLKCSGWTDHEKSVASKDHFINYTNTEQASEYFIKVPEKVENHMNKTPWD